MILINNTNITVILQVKHPNVI